MAKLRPFDKVMDHGNPRETASTGAVRESSKNKGRFDLVPYYPLLRLALHYGNGAEKYAERNWEKGLPLHRFVESAERHLGEFKDGDRSEDHLAAVLWNIFGYIWTEREIAMGRLPEELRDTPWGASVCFPPAPPSLR